MERSSFNTRYLLHGHAPTKNKMGMVPKKQAPNGTRLVTITQEKCNNIKTVTEVDRMLSESTVEWLKKSLVCHSDHPADVSSLANVIV